MKKLLSKYKILLTLGLLITLLGLSVRYIRITVGEQPIFADEAIYIRWAQIMKAEPALRFLPQTDGKQPLFMWSMFPLLKFINDPLIAGRLLSALLSLGTLIGVMGLSYSLFMSFPAALLAGSIYALSPYAVFFDSMALVDSMLSLFGVWTLILGYWTVRLKRLDLAMITGFTLGAALLTKSPAIYFALLLPSVLVFAEFSEKKRKMSIDLFHYGGLFGIIYLVAFGMYNILRLGPNFHMLSSRSKDYIYPLSHLFESPLDPLLPYLDRSIEWFWIWGPGAFLLLVILGIVFNIRKYFRSILLLSLWGLVPLFLSAEFGRVFTARYIVYLLPALSVLAGSVFLTKRFSFILKLIFAAFIIQALYINFFLITDIQKAPMPRSERSGYLEEWTSGYGIKETSEYLIDLQEIEPQTKIVVGTEGFFGTLPDGLQAYLQGYPQITVIGVGVDLLELSTSLIESKQSGNRTFLVVNSSRMLFDSEEAGLELVAAYPKAFRPTGTREYNIHGPRDVLYLFELN